MTKKLIYDTMYAIRNKDGTRVLAGWDDPFCHPTKATLTSMYDAGMVLVVDGKAMSKTEAIKLMPSKAPKHSMVTDTREG